jgi:DNA-binding CsgD family transcriptional regulator
MGSALRNHQGGGSAVIQFPQEFPFVGRREEQSRLADFLQRIRTGKGGACFLEGPAGVGKSRIVQAALASSAQGLEVARGQAFTLEQDTPYGIFADALGPLVRGISADRLQVMTRGWSEELAVLLPGLLPSPEGPSSLRSLTSDEAVHRLRWILGDLLREMAEEAPLLLVLEDLQWADESSLDLLHFLGRSVAEETNLGILGVVRTDPQEGALARVQEIKRSLIRLGVAESIPVSPLSLADTRDLLERTFHLAGPSRDAAAADLHGWTAGNPFYMYEILRGCSERGILRREGDVWVGWSSLILTLPEDLEQLLRDRVADLSGEARLALELGAAFGLEVAHRALEATWVSDDGDLVQAVEELEGAGLLREAQLETGPGYQFPHALLHQAVYGGLSTPRRQQLHTRIATVLVRGRDAAWAGTPDDVARHFLRGGQSHLDSEGLEALLEAGRRALKLGLGSQAERFFRGVHESDAEAEIQEQGTEGLARALQRMGRYEEAEALWSGLRAERSARGDAAGSADALRREGMIRYWSGHRDEAVELLSQALAEATAAKAPELQGAILLARAACFQETGRLDSAGSDLTQALELGQASGSLDLQARAHRGLLLLHTWMGPPEVAEEHAERAHALVGDLADPRLVWSVRWARAVFYGLTGKGDAFAAEVEGLREAEEALRSPIPTLLLSELELQYAWARGDWDEAMAIGEEAIDLAREMEQESILSRLLVWTALIHLGRGHMERAQGMIQDAWELAQAAAVGDTPDIHAQVAAFAGRAMLAMEKGEYPQAVELATKGLDHAREVGYLAWGIHRLLPVLTEAQLRVGSLDEAEQLGRRLRDDAAKLGHRLGLAWADASDALGLWLKGGDPSRAVDLLGEAAEALAQVPMIPDAARLRRQRAGRLAELDRRSEALEELREVHELFQHMGAEPELDKTRIMFRELGARPPSRSQGEDLSGLTEREVEIARLASEGRSNKAIARELQISPRTVGTHLSRVYRKLGVSSRAALGRVLFEMGSLSQEAGGE